MPPISLATPVWLPAPDRLSLAGDQIHVWRISLDRPISTDQRRLLDSTERRRSARLQAPSARHRFEAAHIAKRLLLGRYLARPPRRLSFIAETKGKPLLVDPDGLEFTLSHSGELALLAVARGRCLGVDIERLRPVDQAGRIAARLFSPAQLELLQTLPEERRANGFFALWTEFEARQKVSGAGLFGPRPTAGEVSSHSFVPAPGFVGALAWKSSRETVVPRFYRLSD